MEALQHVFVSHIFIHLNPCLKLMKNIMQFYTNVRKLLLFKLIYSKRIVFDCILLLFLNISYICRKCIKNYEIHMNNGMV